MASRRKSPRRGAAQKRAQAETRTAAIKVGIVGAILLAIGSAYFVVTMSRRSLDEATMCPSQIDSVTVLLVDVTDPLTLPQRQDLLNQLQSLKNQIPRYGRLAIYQVDATSAQLLNPVEARCNPGTSDDASEWTGNPAAVQDQHDQGFARPLDAAFDRVAEASGSERSPILESIQSVALTELQRPELAGAQKRIIVVSDLLQNTDAISFYSGLPEAQTLIAGDPFRVLRTDLRNVDVELWMLQRADAAQTQPRSLITLWEQLIQAEGGRVTRAYNVSG